jgi:UDP-N-acetylmuramoyl-L-alanyl-D-glutamate--2,6-diaminopimelate ligase
MSRTSAASSATADRPLESLVRELSYVHESGQLGGARVRRICQASEEVRPGDLFVAVRGTQADGHDFVGEAVRRGAVAVVVERPVEGDLGVPVLQVMDTHRAVARLAAAWYEHPARSLRLVGISGTVGKTSVLSMLRSILDRGGLPVATIGSLGVQIGDRVLEETGYTAPDALVLQESLARIRDEGCELVVMEVTSHALDQQRVHGLWFELGIFTNLLPLEHREYHGSFEEYVRTKTRFFDQLAPGALLVYNADDLAVAGLIGERDLRRIGCGTSDEAQVRVEDVTIAADGTRLRLRAAGDVPGLNGSRGVRGSIELHLRLLGRANVANAALAGAAALAMGVAPAVVRDALASVSPSRRRMEMLHDGEFRVIDDTVGHPESITAVFEVALALAPRRVHVVIGVRGMRGPLINREMAEALVVWAPQSSVEALVVTRSEEAADERNTVSDEELEAFLEPLRTEGIPFTVERRLDRAVEGVLQRAEAGDLVLLLGAQGMDDAGVLARRWLQEKQRHRSGQDPAD